MLLLEREKAKEHLKRLAAKRLLIWFRRKRTYPPPRSPSHHDHNHATDRPCRETCSWQSRFRMIYEQHLTADSCETLPVRLCSARAGHALLPEGSCALSFSPITPERSCHLEKDGLCRPLRARPAVCCLSSRGCKVQS